MTTSYKGRKAETGKRAEVYFNLHHHLFSVKQGGKVVEHAQTVYLQDVTFHVSESGRQRVLREKRKNVHATVRGTFFLAINEPTPYKRGYREAYYNPYKQATFTDKETGEPLHQASEVVLSGKRIYYRNEEA